MQRHLAGDTAVNIYLHMAMPWIVGALGYRHCARFGGNRCAATDEHVHVNIVAAIGIDKRWHHRHKLEEHRRAARTFVPLPTRMCVGVEWVLVGIFGAFKRYAGEHIIV